MEELRNLEKVQRMLEFMDSRGVSNSNHHSNRFLANFIIFMIQPCEGLDINDKCCVLSYFIPTLSSSFLEDAYQHHHFTTSSEQNSGFQQSPVGDALVSCNQTKEYSLLQSSNENMAVVGLDSMQMANSTLEDFCRSYFMFHGLDVSKPQSIFKYLPILSFTESYIYQLDKMNEKMLQTPNNEKCVYGEKDKREIDLFVSCFSNDPVRPLVTVLEHKGLLTERIREELRQGEEYWALERKLCSALINKEEILVEDVMKAVHLKSFDYRVLNLLLYELQGTKVEELHMEFLSLSEFLVEVSDDLFTYFCNYICIYRFQPYSSYFSIYNFIEHNFSVMMLQDDVLENNFNILRMFIRIYGPSAAPAMLAKYISEAEEKYECLLKLLDPHLSLNYQKRCVEATKEGGKVSEHPLGTWTIPTVIQDEELYRLQLKSESS
uniref:Uncharacterized protein n=1 Tax=Phaseolus vulgaris TaxID=3885 RepID=V7D366_PHAVU|nr:hypothetical protein PHAVU_001G253200g [Phaseolus vulgaris]ESW35656.1 hypothetical protein PHAVU_001G253200g [Phaseolus vulgaris]